MLFSANLLHQSPGRLHWRTGTSHGKLHGWERSSWISSGAYQRRVPRKHKCHCEYPKCCTIKKKTTEVPFCPSSVMIWPWALNLSSDTGTVSVLRGIPSAVWRIPEHLGVIPEDAQQLRHCELRDVSSTLISISSHTLD